MPELIERLKARRENRAGHRCGHAGDFRSRLPTRARGVGGEHPRRRGAGSVGGDRGDFDCGNSDRPLYLRGIRAAARRGADATARRTAAASRARWSSMRRRAGWRIRLARWRPRSANRDDAAVVREITKTYEETVRGTLGELERHFRATPALGEIVISRRGRGRRQPERAKRRDRRAVEAPRSAARRRPQPQAGQRGRRAADRPWPSRSVSGCAQGARRRRFQ